MKPYPPPKFSELSALRGAGLLCKSIVLDVAHKLIRQRRRIRDQVTNDYDQGEWRGHLVARRWETAQDLNSYVIPDNQQTIVATVAGRLVSISVQDYYHYRTKSIAEVLRTYAGDTEALIEIGSGAGRNLFALALCGQWPKLRGLELSPTGMEVTRLAAARFGLSGLSVGPIDLLEPASAGFSELRGATVFSFYCLEQLPAHTESVLTALLRAGVKRVIHMEPSAEMLSFYSLKDLATISYIWRQHYLNDIVSAAKRLEDKGLIRILAAKRLGFAPTLRNPPTLVVWEPANG